MQGDAYDPSSFAYDIEVEQPHADLGRFEGKIHLDENGSRVATIHSENLMLRGCKLKNTASIAGFIVYAGQETKASLNNRGARFKRSKLEDQINSCVIWCILLLAAMCLIGAVANGIWTAGFSDTSAIIFLSLATNSTTSSPAMQAFINFWTYVIILQAMIPIGLYLTIEFVKLGQIIYIENDMQLYDEASKTMAECKAWNITEDLGQIQYVFCDKTGTLTENQMIFKRCSVNGLDYADADKSDSINGSGATARGSGGKGGMGKSKSQKSTAQKIPMERLQRKLVSTMTQSTTGPLSEQDGRIFDFFLVMSVCNSVLVSAKRQPPPTTEVDNAEGPDPTPAAGAHSNVTELDNLNHIDSNGVKRPRRLGAAGDGATGNSADRHQQQQQQQPHSSGEPTDAELLAAYISDSPDEAALVSAACRTGLKLLESGPHRCCLEMSGRGKVKVRVLHRLPFDSDRKRMSVVIRHPLTKKVTLLTKGADSAILGLLETPNSDDPSSDEERCRLNARLHLENYANHGLRTLCLACRTLGDEEYADWLAEFRRVDASMSSDRASAIRRLAVLLERDLRLLGVTGIEDRLQDGVQDTIASLRAAGMSVWVLTGDKQETALQVALEAKLLSPRQTLLKLNAGGSRAECTRLVRRYLARLERDYPAEAQFRQRFLRPAVRAELALVVDGDTLRHCLAKSEEATAEDAGGSATPREPAAAAANDTDKSDDSNLPSDFLRLAQQCASVICCRSAPRQKAAVVSLVKAKGLRTLAIGDGANDVNMIQTADVGVGISGQEGMQAVMAADFSLARFRFLKRLLLVHGHWCYDRLARLALLLFYKNVIYCMLLFWNQMFNGFSGQVHIGQIYQLFFNLVMTSLPPLIMGIFDKHIRDDILMANPVLYMDSSNSRSFLPWHFWYNISDATWQSLVVFFVPYLAIMNSDVDIFSFGDIVIGATVITSILHNCLEVRGWTILHWFSFVGSPIVGWILIAMCIAIICTNCLHPENPYYQIIYNMGTPLFWLAQAVVPGIALLPRICYRAFTNSLSKNLSVQAMRLQNLPRHRVSPDLSRSLRVPRDVFAIGGEADVYRSMRMRSTPMLRRSAATSVGASAFLNQHRHRDVQQPQDVQSGRPQAQQRDPRKEPDRSAEVRTTPRHVKHRRSRSDVLDVEPV